jgi:hypothetical protein
MNAHNCAKQRSRDPISKLSLEILTVQVHSEEAETALGVRLNVRSVRSVRSVAQVKVVVGTSSGKNI